MQNQDLLTTQDVMDNLRVSKTTVLALIRKGNLPALKVSPRCFRVRKDDLAAFVKARSGGNATA